MARGEGGMSGARRPRFRRILVLERKREGSQSWTRARVSVWREERSLEAGVD